MRTSNQFVICLCYLHCIPCRLDLYPIQGKGGGGGGVPNSRKGGGGEWGSEANIIKSAIGMVHDFFFTVEL